MRPHLVDQRQQVGPRVAFDVEFDVVAARRQQRGQVADVARR